MDNNIYYNPEKFGLQIVKDADGSDGCYQFDMIVIWKDRDGRYWIGSDSGCSCPLPFEDQGVDDLTPIYHLSDVVRYADSVWGTPDPDSYSFEHVANGKADLLSGLILD